MLTFVGKYLMGAGEIGDRLGVSRQRVQQLIAHPRFPAPYDELQMGKVWTIESVEAWIREHRPALHDTEAETPVLTETSTPVRKGNRTPRMPRPKR